MKWQQVQDSPDAAHVVVLDPGEEAVGALTGFARDAKDHRRTAVDEQCEVLSLLGDVAVGE